MQFSQTATLTAEFVLKFCQTFKVLLKQLRRMYFMQLCSLHWHVTMVSECLGITVFY